MKNYRNYGMMLAASMTLVISSCKKDDEAPEEENELEVITDVKLVFTNTNDASDIVEARAQDPDGTGFLTYQWQKSSDGYSWTDIGTKSSYLIKYDDSDEYIRAVVTYTDDDGFSESITTDTIQIDKHSIHNSLNSLKSQLSNLTYSTSYFQMKMKRFASRET